MQNFHQSHGVPVLGVVISRGSCKLKELGSKEPKISDLSHMMFTLELPSWISIVLKSYFRVQGRKKPYNLQDIIYVSSPKVGSKRRLRILAELPRADGSLSLPPMEISGSFAGKAPNH